MQSLESDGLRDHLANFAEQLNKARQMIYPPDRKPSKLGALLPTLTEVVAKEHKRLLARKSIIEKRKEEQERQLLEMVKIYEYHFFYCLLNNCLLKLLMKKLLK